MTFFWIEIMAKPELLKHISLTNFACIVGVTYFTTNAQADYGSCWAALFASGLCWWAPAVEIPLCLQKA